MASSSCAWHGDAIAIAAKAVLDTTVANLEIAQALRPYVSGQLEIDWKRSNALTGRRKQRICNRWHESHRTNFSRAAERAGPTFDEVDLYGWGFVHSWDLV